jgi:hypothetical protein
LPARSSRPPCGARYFATVAGDPRRHAPTLLPCDSFSSAAWPEVTGAAEPVESTRTAHEGGATAYQGGGGADLRRRDHLVRSHFVHRGNWTRFEARCRLCLKRHRQQRQKSPLAMNDSAPGRVRSADMVESGLLVREPGPSTEEAGGIR